MHAIRRLFAPIMFGLVLSVGFFVSPFSAHALTISTEYSDIRRDGIIFANICSAPFETDADTAHCACKDSGRCTVEQALQVAVNISYLILALSGSAALIAFVYGGFEWILSAGYPERVQRGKDAITGAAIGLVIVFGAYAFINLVISILKTGEPATTNIEDTIGTEASDIIQTE